MALKMAGGLARTLRSTANDLSSDLASCHHQPTRNTRKQCEPVSCAPPKRPKIGRLSLGSTMSMCGVHGAGSRLRWTAATGAALSSSVVAQPKRLSKPMSSICSTISPAHLSKLSFRWLSLSSRNLMYESAVKPYDALLTRTASP